MQTEKTVTASLILDIDRIFPVICVRHLRVTVAVHVGDGNSARIRCETRKERSCEVGIEATIAEHPEWVRIRSVHLRAFKKLRPGRLIFYEHVVGATELSKVSPTVL